MTQWKTKTHHPSLLPVSAGQSCKSFPRLVQSSREGRPHSQGRGDGVSVPPSVHAGLPSTERDRGPGLNTNGFPHTRQACSGSPYETDRIRRFICCRFTKLPDGPSKVSAEAYNQGGFRTTPVYPLHPSTIKLSSTPGQARQSEDDWRGITEWLIAVAINMLESPEFSKELDRITSRVFMDTLPTIRLLSNTILVTHIEYISFSCTVPPPLPSCQSKTLLFTQDICTSHPPL